MHIDDERIAIISDGCRCSQSEAERLYHQQVASGEWTNKIEQMKEAQRSQRLRKMSRHGYDRKMKGAGDE